MENSDLSHHSSRIGIESETAMLSRRTFSLLMTASLAARAAEVPEQLKVWFAGSLTLMVISGIVLVSGEAMKCFYNPAFRWKMLLLAAAIVFYYTLHRRLIWSQTDDMTIGSRIAGAVSLALWLSVGIAGRAIGLI